MGTRSKKKLYIFWPKIPYEKRNLNFLIDPSYGYDNFFN